MIHLNKNSWTPAQKIDLENSLQQSLATLSFFLHFDMYLQLLKETGNSYVCVTPKNRWLMFVS